MLSGPRGRPWAGPPGGGDGVKTEPVRAAAAPAHEDAGRRLRHGRRPHDVKLGVGVVARVAPEIDWARMARPTVRVRSIATAMKMRPSVIAAEGMELLTPQLFIWLSNQW